MMQYLFDPLNFMLLVAAITLVWFLRSVLGQRTGFEHPPETPTKPVEILPPMAKTTSPAQSLKSNEAVDAKFSEMNDELQNGLQAIRKAQPDFDLENFIYGAKSAHEIILQAFANGDKAKLRGLLAKPVYDSFEKTIDQRKQEGHQSQFKFVGINSAKLIGARLDGTAAVATVRFKSEVISALLDGSKQVIAGDPNTVSVVDEIWIFERDTTSRDPNWKLGGTDDPGLNANHSK